VDGEDEVMVVMEKGKIVRSRVDEVRRTGRNTMGVQFATPDKHDSIVAVARNADRGIDVVLGGATDDEESGMAVTTDTNAPILTGSASEDATEAGSVTFDPNMDDDADDNAGGNE